MPPGIVNNCKHDSEFLLSYNMLTHNYGFTCARCLVFKLSFNPTIYPAGVAYSDRNQGTKDLPKIDYKAGEL